MDIPIDDDGIRLGQLLKLAGVVGAGGEVKSLLANGLVLVNGVREDRRGRQLRVGDVIRVEASPRPLEYRVVADA